MNDESKVLGKQVDYPSTYAPEILVAVPRSVNRAILQPGCRKAAVSPAWMYGTPMNLDF
jgi:NADPH-dependent 7-cyano-7-deazaguanine reductase QueF-like protein